MVRAEDELGLLLGVPHGGRVGRRLRSPRLTPTNPTTTLFSPLALCAASIASAHFAAFFPMSCARTRPPRWSARVRKSISYARFVFGFSSRFVPAGGSRDVTAPTMETDAAEASDEPPSALRSENGVGSGVRGPGRLRQRRSLSDHRSPGNRPMSRPLAAAATEPDDSGGSPAPGVAAQSGPADAASAPQTLALAPGTPKRRRERLEDRGAENRAEDPGFRRGFFGAPEEANATRAYDAKNESAARGVRVLPDGRVGGRIDALRRRVGIVVPRLFAR